MTLAAAILACSPLLTPDVLVVSQFGPGDFSNLADAVAAAQDGDTLLLRPAFLLEGATIDGKSLQIIGDVGAQVPVRELEIRNLAADQSVVVSNLRLLATVSDEGLVATGNAGTILVQESALAGAVTGPLTQADGGARIENCASVTFADCEFTGSPVFGPSVIQFDGTPALVVDGSSVQLFDCTVTGGEGSDSSIGITFDGGTGAPGVVAFQSDLFLSGTSVTGGRGGDGADAQVLGSVPCSGGGDGAAALALQGGSFVYRDSSFLSGEPGEGGAPAGTLPGCTDGVSGAAVVASGSSELALPGSARSFSVSPNPVRAGQVASATFAGEAGDIVAWGVSFNAAVAPLLDIGGPILPGTPLIVLEPGVIGPSGELVLGFPISPLPAGLDSIELFEQAVHLNAGLTSLFASAPRFVTHLDASF